MKSSYVLDAVTRVASKATKVARKALFDANPSAIHSHIQIVSKNADRGERRHILPLPIKHEGLEAEDSTLK